MLYQINMKLHQYKGHPAKQGALYIDAASYKNGIGTDIGFCTSIGSAKPNIGEGANALAVSLHPPQFA
jgi:hypothetical protein